MMVILALGVVGEVMILGVVEGMMVDSKHLLWYFHLPQLLTGNIYRDIYLYNGVDKYSDSSYWYQDSKQEDGYQYIDLDIEQDIQVYNSFLGS